MTNEDIVQRLREDYCQCVNEPEYKPIRCYTCEAADTIERLVVGLKAEEEDHLREYQHHTATTIKLNAARDGRTNPLA